jgi:hypothetical protein
MIATDKLDSGGPLPMRESEDGDEDDGAGPRDALADFATREDVERRVQLLMSDMELGIAKKEDVSAGATSGRIHVHACADGEWVRVVRCAT